MEKSRMYDMIGYENEDDYHIQMDKLLIRISTNI